MFRHTHKSRCNRLTILSQPSLEASFSRSPAGLKSAVFYRNGR